MLRMWKLAALMMTVAACSYADMITFTHSGFGFVSVGAEPFTFTDFTITDVGDTANRIAFAGGFFINTSAVIFLDGIGTFDILTPTRTFVSNTAKEVGFGRATGSDLYDGPTAAVLGTWDMLSSIGPLTGSAVVATWASPPVNTSGGLITFMSRSNATTFTATVAPEPSSLIPLGMGLIAIAGTAWRRHKLGQLILDSAKCS